MGAPRPPAARLHLCQRGRACRLPRLLRQGAEPAALPGAHPGRPDALRAHPPVDRRQPGGPAAGRAARHVDRRADDAGVLRAACRRPAADRARPDRPSRAVGGPGASVQGSWARPVARRHPRRARARTRRHGGFELRLLVRPRPCQRGARTRRQAGAAGAGGADAAPALRDLLLSVLLELADLSLRAGAFGAAGDLAAAGA